MTEHDRNTLAYRGMEFFTAVKSFKVRPAEVAITILGQCYKTFYGHNLQMFAIN